MLHLNNFCMTHLEKHQQHLLLADLRSLSMLLSGSLEPRHNVRIPARPQEGVETAGVCGPRGQCHLSLPGPQERPGPCDGGRGQEGEPLGGGEAQLHHELVR